MSADALSPRDRIRLLRDCADAEIRGNVAMANGHVLRAKAAWRTADALRRKLDAALAAAGVGTSQEAK